MLEDACKLYATDCRESESESANQKLGRSFLYTEQLEKHTMTSSMSSISFLQMFFEIQAAVE